MASITIGNLDEPHLLEAVTRLHIDGALEILSAEAHRATYLAAVTDEHGWRLGRIVDPFGHEWEIGHPLGRWPPD